MPAVYRQLCLYAFILILLYVAVSMPKVIHYLRQGGYVIVIVVVCLFVCSFVCLLATLRKNFRTDLHEIFRQGSKVGNEPMSK